ncbi:MAG: LysR family transcriptional regulator [Oscillospiraceae bacterium]|nr:LysR family transcriptional regulator [Oscillospiraceae bacterium]
METMLLQCFLTVAKTLNFSEAARRCHVSQPTISRYIGDLEKTYGTALFTRTRRDVELTAAGKALLPYAAEITESLTRAQAVLDAIGAGGGRLRVACDATSGVFPARCLQQFAALCPEVAVELAIVPGGEQARALKAADFDFYFLPRDQLPDGAGLQTLVTHRDALSLVTAKGAAPDEPDMTALAGEKLILLSEEESPIVYMEVLDLLGAFHITPRIAACPGSVRAVLLSVGAGLGVSILPTMAVSGVLPELVDTRPIAELDTEIAYAMAWRAPLSGPAAQRFLELAQSLAIGEAPAQF